VSYSAAGDAAKTQYFGQQLVDVSQRLHHENIACDALCSSALSWLKRGNDDEAAALYTAAIGVSATTPESDDLGMMRTVVRTVMVMVFHVEQLRGAQSSVFYRAFEKAIDKQAKGMGKVLRPAIDTARQALTSASTELGVGTSRARGKPQTRG
jgi:hypothetical protein